MAEEKAGGGERAIVSLKLDGQIDGVEVDHFCRAMRRYARLLKGAAAVQHPGAEVEVYIQTVSPGCLDAVLGVVASALTVYSSLPGGALGVARATVEFAKTALEARAKIAAAGGAKEVSQTGGHVSVATGNGSTVNVTNDTYVYMQMPKVEEWTAEMMRALRSCDGVSGLTVTTGDGEPLVIPAGDFNAVADTRLPEMEEEQVVTEEMVMDVVNPTLVADDDRDWKLSWRGGGTILARLDDEEFKERLRRNDPTCRFGPGTMVRVVLQRDISIDPRTHRLRHPKGTILKVKEIIQPEDAPETLRMELPDDGEGANG